ncbi:MAG: hypothetical protein Q6356_007555 [Candidatus Wukongarchaeota archaeon]|nr:hypothetical protein [Candidatus Wukongarchaeota archaeon]
MGETSMIDELNKIHAQVVISPKNAPPEVKKRFWKLVGQIKRTSNPDQKVVNKASEIRDLLYAQRLGKTIPLKLVLPIWFVIGTTFFFEYFRNAGQEDWGGLTDWPCVLTILGVIAFFYPFGRLIAGKLTGIKFDGLSRDIYFLPTLKINYPSYLKTSPPKRQWMFFIAGIWTVITAVIVGIVGYLRAEDITGFAIATIVAILELVALTGILGKWGGEMGHFLRERRIVRDWKATLKSLNN